MHCHCGTNNRAPRWTFTDPCKAEVRPGAREESASPAWLAATKSLDRMGRAGAFHHIIRRKAAISDSGLSSVKDVQNNLLK